MLTQPIAKINHGDPGDLSGSLRESIEGILAKVGVKPDEPLVQNAQVSLTRAVFAYIEGFVRIYVFDLKQPLPDYLPGKQLRGRVDFNLSLDSICPRIEQTLDREGFEYEHSVINLNQHVVYYQFAADADAHGHPLAFKDAFSALAELRDRLQKGR